MARRKNQEVDRITLHRYGVDIPLYLTPENTFTATFGTHCETGASATQVKNAMILHIQAVAAVTWVPFIQVELLQPISRHSISEGTPTTAFAGLLIRRAYLGRKLDGEYLECRWELPSFDTSERDERLQWAEPFYYAERGRLRGQDLVLPFEVTEPSGAQRFYFAYTDDLWTRLIFVKDEIARLRAVLELLIGTPAGLNRLLTAQLPALLAAPGRSTG